MGYTPSFTPQYEGGWEDLPLETTPITAEAFNAYDDAIENIEDYLASDESQANLADAYDETATYDLGDYVIYGGDLYKCTTEISTAEEWDSTHWTACIITEEMATSGGTTVVANPSGEATDTLTKLQVENTIYDISGGGGNANIWTGTQAELEEVFDELEEGTQINITDDEQEVVDGGTIYSEDEQVIGLWIDNKPLYQKSFSFTNGVAIAMGSWTDVNSDIPNIGYDKVVRAFSVDANGTYQGDLLCGLNSSDHVQLQSQRNGSGNITANYITLQYTKSTDAPLDVVVGKSTMYIASSDCYSTEEKEVGCAPNGKPLYQKTVDCGALPNNTTKTIAHNISNLENIIELKGTTYSTTNGYVLPLEDIDSDVGINSVIRLYANDTNIYLKTKSNQSVYDSTLVTLKYTKTTDTAGSGQYTPASGKAVHYSTDEQVIGTWVDGSTIYQKTVLHSGVITGAQTATQIAHGITNLGRIIQAEATVYDDHSSPSWMSVPRIAYDANNIGFSGIDNTYINFYVPSAFGNRIKDAHFVLTYTKSV